MSDGLSIQHRRITRTDFRLCSICLSRSQANLYPYALLAVSIRHELTFARLRYSLGGDRPSQTGWYPNNGSAKPKSLASQPPTYPVHEISNISIRLQ